MILITHDLSVLAETCDRVAIMYAGQIAELGAVRDLYANPQHPYTEALLASVLRPEPGHRHGDRAAHAAKGEWSGPLGGGIGCVYASRCPHVIDRCRTEAPALTVVDADHAARCHRIGELRLTPLTRGHQRSA